MPHITSPDGVVLDTRRGTKRPLVASIAVHYVDARWDVDVHLSGAADDVVLARLGGRIDVYGDGDTTLDRLRNLAEIGAEITRQAEALIEDLS